MVVLGGAPEMYGSLWRRWRRPDDHFGEEAAPRLAVRFQLLDFASRVAVDLASGPRIITFFAFMFGLLFSEQVTSCSTALAAVSLARIDRIAAANLAAVFPAPECDPALGEERSVPAMLREELSTINVLTKPPRIAAAQLAIFPPVLCPPWSEPCECA